MSVFKGSATAIITPFNQEGVDFEGLAKVVDYQLEGQADGIVVCGTTGEASTMTTAEKRAAIEFVVKRVAGRIPVIAGTGSNATAHAIEDSAAAEALGVDALLVVTPYYNKTSQAGLVAHFHAIADAVKIPIITYNVPSRTGLNILPATMKEILKHERIVGTKEASGNIEQIVQLAALCPDCDIYSGNDDHVLPLLSMGGKGVISTSGNVIPKDMHDLCAAFFAGDLEKARALQCKILPIWRAAFSDVNPIPIKTMCSILGLSQPGLRLPLIAPAPEKRAALEDAMRAYGLI